MAIEELKAALKWVLTNSVVYSPAHGQGIYARDAEFQDSGCGCCSNGRMEPPTSEMKSLLMEVMS